MRHLIKKHKRKIIYTTPVLFFLFLTYTAVISPTKDPVTDLFLTSSSTRGTVGYSFSVDVTADTDTPINAVEASLSFPPEDLEVTSIDQTNSIIDLWVHQPSFLNDIGTITVDGGILRTGGFVKTGKLFTVNFLTKKAGTAKITADKVSFALADGKGTLATPKITELSYEIAAPEIKPVQSPDMNKSGSVNIIDAGLWVMDLFKPGNIRADLNGDGKINLKDLYFFWK
jgi:hypothetical protein